MTWIIKTIRLYPKDFKLTNKKKILIFKVSIMNFFKELKRFTKCTIDLLYRLYIAYTE